MSQTNVVTLPPPLESVADTVTRDQPCKSFGMDPVEPAETNLTAAYEHRRGIYHKGVLSLIDQAVVSGTNFLTTVFLGHTNQAELGVYWLGFNVVLLATCTQGALISSPYTVFGSGMNRDARAAYAGSTIWHQWGLSALLTLILTIAGLGIAFGLGPASFGPTDWMLAAMLPFILVREFLRRVAFAHFRLRIVLALDVAVSILQLTGLAALWQTDRLTAGSAFGAIGVACALAGGATFFLMRSHFARSQRGVWTDLKLNWSFGKWAFAAQLALLAAASTIPWLLALMAGTDDTGRFAACTSIIMIVNPVLIGLNNFLGPQAIHVFHRQGLPALRRMTWRISSAGVGLVSFVVLLLWLSGGKLLVVVYGEKFIGNEVVISIMAFNILGFAVGMGVENGLSALHRPDLVFWSNLLCLLVTLAAGFPLVWQYGVIGAAWAAVLGTATATISKILLFVYAMRRQSGLVATSAAGANLAIDNAI